MAGRIVFAGILGLALLGLTWILVAPPYVDEEVRWRNGEVELVGTLYLPRGDGPHPAAVFVHGAGGWTRDELLFRVHAERLAGTGVALLIYDKRGCGASTGDWRTATFEELAEDALAGVRRLRADERIRAEAVGLFATSQGGSVALLAAERSPDVSFLVTLSLSPLSPAEQERDAALRGLGVELEPTPTSRDFDPLPRLRTLELPHFAAQGALDELVPGPRAAEVLAAFDSIAVVLVPGAEHTLRPWPASYWRALEDWLDATVLAGR